MHTTYITIEHLNSVLRLNIGTLCSRLRNKEYVAGSEPHQNALNNLLYFELMADELNILLGHRQSLIKAIEQYLIGEEFDPKSSGGNARSIYQYCLMYFENVECPLGSFTSELKAWGAMYTDMQRRLEEGYKEFFPNLDFLTQKQGEQDLISVVETAGPDQDIVASNAIVEFNQRMGKISKLLKEEGSIVDILTLLKENSNDH